MKHPVCIPSPTPVSASEVCPADHFLAHADAAQTLDVSTLQTAFLFPFAFVLGLFAFSKAIAKLLEMLK